MEVYKMIIDNLMWKKLKKLKQELLDLKQIKKANCVSKYYTHTVSPNQYYNAWLITYKSGSQPIIAEILSYQDSALSVPVNNSQYLFIYSQIVDDFTILSTREVESVEPIE